MVCRVRLQTGSGLVEISAGSTGRRCGDGAEYMDSVPMGMAGCGVSLWSCRAWNVSADIFTQKYSGGMQMLRSIAVDQLCVWRQFELVIPFFSDKTRDRELFLYKGESTGGVIYICIIEWRNITRIAYRILPVSERKPGVL